MTETEARAGYNQISPWASMTEEQLKSVENHVQRAYEKGQADLKASAEWKKSRREAIRVGLRAPVALILFALVIMGGVSFMVSAQQEAEEAVPEVVAEPPVESAWKHYATTPSGEVLVLDLGNGLRCFIEQYGQYALDSHHHLGCTERDGWRGEP